MARMEDRKVRPGSLRNVRKRVLAKERGEFFDDAAAWTDEKVDLLLEGYLVEGWCSTSPDPSRKTFHSVLGKTEDAVQTKLRKLSIRYKDSELYRPVKRTDRTGTLWTHRDLRMMRRFTNETGRAHDAHSSYWISLVLGRSEKEILWWMEDTARRKEAGAGVTLFGRPSLQGWSWDRVAHFVYQSLKSLKRVNDDLV